MIEISTDKENYKREEVVHVNVKNNGNESLAFSDTKSDVIIRKLNESQTYEPSTLGTLTEEYQNITNTFIGISAIARANSSTKGYTALQYPWEP